MKIASRYVDGRPEPDRPPTPRCAYCFGLILGVEPHVVRGRSYHPPRMDPGNRAFKETGCAQADKELVAPYHKPPKVDANQLGLS